MTWQSRHTCSYLRGRTSRTRWFPSRLTYSHWSHAMGIVRAVWSKGTSCLSRVRACQLQTGIRSGRIISSGRRNRITMQMMGRPRRYIRTCRSTLKCSLWTVTLIMDLLCKALPIKRTVKTRSSSNRNKIMSKCSSVSRGRLSKISPGTRCTSTRTQA